MQSVPKGRHNLEPGTGVPGRISRKSSPEGTAQWGVLTQVLSPRALKIEQRLKIKITHRGAV
jgi:hypothetical protein